MKRYLLSIALLCLVATGAQSFWQSRQQVAISGGAVIPLSLDGTPVSANSGSSSSFALPAFTSSNPNDIILIPLVSNGLPVTSITGGSLSFARVPGVGAAGNLDLWWALAPSPLSGVVFTVNTTGMNFITAMVLAVTGGKTSAPFDAVSTAFAASGTYVTLTTDVANTFGIGVTNQNGGAIPGAGWTNLTSSNFLTVDYRIFSTTVSGNVFDTGSTGASIVAAIVQGP